MNPPKKIKNSTRVLLDLALVLRKLGVIVKPHYQLGAGGRRHYGYLVSQGAVSMHDSLELAIKDGINVAMKEPADRNKRF